MEALQIKKSEDKFDDKEPCFKCKEPIVLMKDKYVALTTMNKGRKVEEALFHFKCWQQYFADCVKNKLKKTAKKVTSNVKEMLSGFNVDEVIKSMPQ